MTATGIVRRIDDLGRVVVPKEMRRKLRWRPGAPVEIFTAPDGVICLKRYTSMGEDKLLAQMLADSIAQESGRIVCVSDMYHIIAVSSGVKAQLLDMEISLALENVINARKLVITERMPIVDDETACNVYSQVIISPVISEGDAEGAIILLSKDSEMSGHEAMLARTAALFLGKQLAI